MNEKHLNSLDGMTRKELTLYRTWRPKSDVDRLYKKAEAKQLVSMENQTGEMA